MRAYLGIDVDYVDLDLNLSDLSKVRSQHLTLYFWGDLSEDEAERIVKKLKDYRYNSFSVEASQVLAFPSKEESHLVALSFSFLGELVSLRDDVLKYLGLVSDEKFEPHITLYRKEKLDASFKESKELLKQIDPVRVAISNVSLYASNPEKGLNEYELLGKAVFD